MIVLTPVSVDVFYRDYCSHLLLFFLHTYSIGSLELYYRIWPFFFFIIWKVPSYNKHPHSSKPGERCAQRCLLTRQSPQNNSANMDPMFQFPTSELWLKDLISNPHSRLKNLAHPPSIIDKSSVSS